MDAVIVTGSNGGIGKAICQLLEASDYFVLGIDKNPNTSNQSNSLQFDISRLSDSEVARSELYSAVYSALGDHNLIGLVNNAAIQIVESIDSLQIHHFTQTMNVNVTAPLVLSKMFYPLLEKSHGSIVNIGSIHSKLTKPGFVSYATSKSALEGLTKALAVDYGNRIAVNCIVPAAIATEMLKDGFKGNPNKLKELQQHHPTGSIGCPTEVAEMVNFIISRRLGFLNGASLQLDGGISSRLHDPL